MSTDVQWEGGFFGKKRQEMIHRRMFGFLCLGEGGNINRGDEIVCDWLTDGVGWSELSEDEETIFASLAKALPDADFHYETSFDYEGGGLEQMYHDIEYVNGRLSLSTTSYGETHGKDEEDENVYWDDDYSCYVRKHETSLWCCIDEEGIIGNDELSEKCLNLEKDALSEILDLIETGTDDPEALMDIGMLYETGLAAIDRNLTVAWNYYLKAAGAGYKDAIRIVKEIFSDECKDDLKELFANKSISKNSFPVFFDLAAKENNAELTARLLEYKASLE